MSVLEFTGASFLVMYRYCFLLCQCLSVDIRARSVPFYAEYDRAISVRDGQDGRLRAGHAVKGGPQQALPTGANTLPVANNNFNIRYVVTEICAGNKAVEDCELKSA